MVKITVETREKVGTIYTMTNENGVQLSAIAHGARLYECLIPVEAGSYTHLRAHETREDSV